jgi:co-chaperonin GroES (HSP10)
LVKDIVTSLSLEERAERAGLSIIIENENRPRPTQGRVIALGSDPIVHDQLKIGDVVFFNPHAGHTVVLEDQEFRMLEFQEVTSVMEEDQSSVEAPTEHNPLTSQEPDPSATPFEQHESVTPPERV